MAVKFLGVSSASGVGTSIPVVTPALDSLKRGDLLFAFIAIQGFVGTSLTPPAGWSVEPSPASIGDLLVFTALHYVGNEEEASTYTFAYPSSKPFIAVVGAYRGVLEDVLFDPVNYPFGFYAPNGSAGGERKQTSVLSVNTPVSGITSEVLYSRALVFFAASHASAKPLLSDVSPFIAMRAKVETSKVSGLLCDVLEPVVLNPLPAYSSAAFPSLSGSIGMVRIFEAKNPVNDTFDTYKAKLMRRMLPPPFDPSYDGGIGQMLTVIGGMDNDIGGLMGSADFLPDETP